MLQDFSNIWNRVMIWESLLGQGVKAGYFHKDVWEVRKIKQLLKTDSIWWLSDVQPSHVIDDDGHFRKVLNYFAYLRKLARIREDADDNAKFFGGFPQRICIRGT